MAATWTLDDGAARAAAGYSSSDHTRSAYVDSPKEQAITQAAFAPWLSFAAALHAASVFFMTGAIWIVHRVHYPLFNRVAPAQFLEFHRQHSARITSVVGPVMVTELGSALVLLWLRPDFFATTLLAAVPQHTRLGAGWDEIAWRRLLVADRLRVLAWSLHALLLLGRLT